MRFVVYRNTGGEEERIAEVYGRSEEAQANARLISCAPELLEAAENLLDKLERLYPIEKVPSVAVLDLGEIIEKAKGEGGK